MFRGGLRLKLLIFNRRKCKIQSNREINKKKRMLLLFSHKLTQDQINEAKNKLQVQEFVNLPENLQSIWSNIPPELDTLDEYLEDIIIWIKNNSTNSDLALVEGDFGATYLVVNFCKKIGVTPLYATTAREVVEEHIDNKVILKRKFKHIKFRRY